MGRYPRAPGSKLRVDSSKIVQVARYAILDLSGLLERKTICLGHHVVEGPNILHSLPAYMLEIL